MGINVQVAEGEFPVLMETLRAPEDAHEVRQAVDSMRDAVHDSALEAEASPAQITAILNPVLELQLPLQEYVPVNTYMPLFCFMIEAAAERLPGIQGIVPLLRPGTFDYTVNNAVLTWIPPLFVTLYDTEH